MGLHPRAGTVGDGHNEPPQTRGCGFAPMDKSKSCIFPVSHTYSTFVDQPGLRFERPAEGSAAFPRGISATRIYFFFNCPSIV